MKKKLFPEIDVDKIDGLSDEEIQALVAQHEDVFLKLRPDARTEDVVGDLTMGEVLEQARAAKDVVEKLNGIRAERIAGATQFEDELEKLTGEIAAKAEGDPGDEDPDVDADVAPAEVIAETVEVTVKDDAGAVVEETVPEPVLAAATQRAARPRLPQPTVTHQPIVEDAEPQVAFVLASGIPGMQEGGAAASLEQIASAMHKKRFQMVSTPEGVRENVVVASADWRDLYPKDRNLSTLTDPAGIRRAIDRIVGPQALAASGGICAPATPYYNLANVSVPVRPVRDSLVQFAATRGGLNYARPATLSDVAASVGIKTAAEDEAGGTFAAKSCLSVDCPDFTETTVDMIYRCLQFGNLNARTFPELVTQWTELSMAYHARVADSALLDAIGAGSTAVTQAQIYGATSSIIDAILYAAAGLRSRHRMDPNSRFDVLFPDWVKGLLAADMVNTQFGRFDVKPGDVQGLLAAYGIDITWYLDQETGSSQIFGAQAAGALLDFPNTVRWYIYPKGSWLFLDGGTLDLGLVRDSALNATNDFQIFMETFEAAAFVGVESLKVTSTVCQNGTVAAPASAFSC